MIRPATLNDGPEVVHLLLQIFDEMQLPSLAHTSNKQLAQLLEVAYTNPSYRYSPTYTTVYTDDETNHVVGVCVGYPHKLEAKIDDVLTPYLASAHLPATTRFFSNDESQPGEWYLDSLAVAPSHQGQGIGGQLLDYTPQLARKFSDVKTISLNVDWENPLAKKLYLRHGFYKQGEVIIGNHHYDHLIHQLTKDSVSGQN